MTDVVDVLVYIVLAIWLFLPALVMNPSAAAIGKHSKTKIDFGRSWRGKRIFGDGKSWLGFFGGVSCGIITGLILLGISYFFDPDNFWGYGGFWGNIGIIVCLSAGAALGDLCGAFIKRRFGLERGHKVPFLDQYDFVIGAFAVTAIFFPNFIYSNYFEGYHLIGFVVLIISVYAIHRAANIIGYKMGVKKEPW